MVEPVTTGAALVGIGWAGKKILGPSLEELGQQLKIFSGKRIEKIFAKAEGLGKNSAQIHPIPPAFALKFFQSASLSEDDELITTLWANLLVNSSKDFNQRHVLYVDILDKLNASDAHILNQMIDADVNADYHSVQWELDQLRLTLVRIAQEILGDKHITHFDWEAAEEFDKRIESLKAHWPIKILETILPHVPYETTPGTISGSSPSRGSANSEAPYDALIRQRLLQSFQISFVVGFNNVVGGVMATGLGVEFIRNCRGNSQ